MHNKTPAERAARVPTIHIISDSIGETAQVVARAAAAQFGVTSPHLEIFSKVKSFEEVRGYLLEHARHHEEVLGDDRMLVMYTLVNADIREPLQGFLAEHPNIVAVDVLTAAVAAVSEMSGMEPVGKPGMLRVVDHNYFKRIGALEFTIAHDDGQNPEDLTKADIVLLGVSRSSKTPLSIYLAQQGLRVANVPLDPTTEPPSQIYDVDRTRLFGLMITPEVCWTSGASASRRRRGRPAAASSPCSRRTTPIRSTSTATWRPVAPSCAGSAASSCTPRAAPWRRPPRRSSATTSAATPPTPTSSTSPRYAALPAPAPRLARLCSQCWSKKWRKLLLRRL